MTDPTQRNQGLAHISFDEPIEPAPPRSRTLRITGSTIAWTLWVLFGVLFEAWALLSGHPKSTFSWKWWSVFRVRQKVPVWVRVLVTVPQLLFLLWLPFHLPFGWLA